MPLNWGIIAPGGIVEQVFPVVWYKGSPNKLAAVASRDLARAKAFAETHAVEGRVAKAYGSYDELIADPNVQAVYIATPTKGRVELVLKCAQAGKHMIAEKPLAETAKEVETMINACRSRNLVFLDATHWVHHPRSKAIRAHIQDSKFGEVVDVQASFGVPVAYTPTQIRFQADVEPLGALGDLGWYPIRMILFAFNNLEPVQVSAVSSPVTGTNPAMASMSGLITFPALNRPDGTIVARTARFFCSFQSPFVQSARIASTSNAVEVNDFVHPWSFIAPLKDGKFDTDKFPTVHHTSKMGGFISQATVASDSSKVGVDELFRRVAGLVEAGKSSDAEIDSFLRADILTHRIFEACVESARKDGMPVKIVRDGKSSL